LTDFHLSIQLYTMNNNKQGLIIGAFLACGFGAGLSIGNIPNNIISADVQPNNNVHAFQYTEFKIVPQGPHIEEWRMPLSSTHTSPIQNKDSNDLSGTIRLLAHAIEMGTNTSSVTATASGSTTVQGYSLFVTANNPYIEKHDTIQLKPEQNQYPNIKNTQS